MQLKLYILEKSRVLKKKLLKNNFSKADLAGFEKSGLPDFFKTLPVIPTLVWGVQKGIKRPQATYPVGRPPLKQL
jgi:hypothetical protein